MSPSPLQPDKNPNRRFQWFALYEVYTGPTGTGAWVPNPNDLIWSDTLGVMKVDDVDYTTGISTLVSINIGRVGGGADPTDILLGLGPESASQAHRMFIDTSVVPHRMSTSALFQLTGTALTHIKVFYGNDITDEPEVISAMFDNAENFISENIPLELVQMDNATNIAVKTPVSGFSTRAVNSGDLVTIVVYKSDGGIALIYRMKAVVTNFIRSSNASQRYVTGIELISPYMSATDSSVIEVPANLTVQSGMFQGRVHFSDGSVNTLPVDGSKFTLAGIEGYIASVPDVWGDLVLGYKLGPNEFAFGVTAPIPDRMLPRPYRIKTTAADNAFTVKMFVVPRWIATGSPSWALDYFLYTLDRDTIYSINNQVSLSNAHPAFDGLAIGHTQTIQASVNLKDIGPFPYYHHSQLFNIGLLALGNDTFANTYATVSYSDGLLYGSGKTANVSVDGSDPALRNLNISNGYTNLTDWLHDMYYETQPLFVNSAEAQAPSPTHVRLRVDTTFYRVITIAQVLAQISNVDIPSPQGRTLRLEFIQRTGSVDKELAIAGLTIKAI